MNAQTSLFIVCCGMRSVEVNGSFVVGEVREPVAYHSSIATLSYVCPSAAVSAPYVLSVAGATCEAAKSVKNPCSAGPGV